MAKTAASTTQEKDSGATEPRFEAALAELEQLVASMEAGQLPLEESLSAYKRGVELLQHCQRQLEDAEQRVRILDKGTLRPLDDGGQS
jgi:exodeoxyribonuclease VII small subunit